MKERERVFNKNLSGKEILASAAWQMTKRGASIQTFTSNQE
jgi:hypothetical protein